MLWLALGLAVLVAVAIIAIGVFYITRPRTATLSFGLPLPEDGPNITWWLRLKGVRDIVAGLIVLLAVAAGGSRWVGAVLLVQAIIPTGDMLTILAAKGSKQRAFGIHGVTALLMILAATSLLLSPPNPFSYSDSGFSFNR